jgi:O-antigen ligase
MLSRRHFAWGTFLKSNKALCCLYAFFFLSAFWSGFPDATIKRVIKDFGNVIIALLLLSGPEPVQTIKALFVRVACLLFPLSFLANRWFPEIGRNYSISGEPMYTGVTTQKNSLGQMVFILCSFILFDIFTARNEEGAKWRTRRWGLYSLLGVGLILLHQSQSKTSLLSILLAVVLFWLGTKFLKMVNPIRGLLCVCCLGLFFYLLNSSLHISDKILAMLGRNASLTGRTDIWSLVMAQPVDRWIGSGFLAFWSTPTGMELINTFNGVKTAHNGYLEVFLSGGLLAVMLLAWLLLSSAKYSWNRMLQNRTHFSILGFAVCALIAVNNVSESSFFMLSPLWFTFLLLTIRVPITSLTMDPASET